jgi:hypothetical protein
MAASFGTNGISSQQNDVFRVVQPLVAGNNVITHNLGFAPVMVEVRNNNAAGAIITHGIVAESTNSVTISVGVAVAMVRISIDS